jgi:2'-5' RNA ligase
MPRLFTGIEIPPDIADRLAMLRGGLPNARWIDRDNYHLTLRFIGDVDRRVAEDVAESLDRVRRPDFSLRLTGVSALGTKRPHAIVAMAEPTAALIELQAEHERILQRFGLPREGRKYTPHVTLARLRHGHPRDIAEYLTLRGGFFAQPFAVERFVLFSSRDSTGGGPYIAEETYDLSPPAAAPLEERPWPGN